MSKHPWDCQAHCGFYGCKDVVTWNDWRGKTSPEGFSILVVSFASGVSLNFVLSQATD